MELPNIFTEVDFVFRPHPLLFVTLKSDKFWGEEKVSSYIEKLESFPNCKYCSGGDYIKTFVDSDALIHDCASYSAEYLYTGNPVCYIHKEDNRTRKQFTELGNKCLDVHYSAYSRDDILNFIQKVVIEGQDIQKETRKNFADNVLKVNYPNASSYIIEYIKKQITTGK